MSKLQIARTAGLCELLDISDATVHRDLKWLDQEGFLERTYGGVILNQQMTFKPEHRLLISTLPIQFLQI